MSENQNETPPIIVKKIKKGEGHHGGAWKVAYADFVTAMMALFIVLWVLGQSEEVKSNVSGYFKDPAGFSDKSGKIIGAGGNSIVDKGFVSQEEIEEYEKEKLREMGEQIYEELASNPEFLGLIDQISIEVVDEGLRIEMIESVNDIFFEIGSAALKEEALSILSNVGKQLQNLPNSIVIEGHTDSRPFNNGILGYTNFELSADRANSARRALIQGGLGENRITEIRGMADRLLRDKNDPFSVVNRRISIIVRYTGA